MKVPTFFKEDLFRIALLEITDNIVNEFTTCFRALEQINDKLIVLNRDKIHKIDVRDLMTEGRKLTEI